MVQTLIKLILRKYGEGVVSIFGSHREYRITEIGENAVDVSFRIRKSKKFNWFGRMYYGDEFQYKRPFRVAFKLWFKWDLFDRYKKYK